MTDKKQAKDLVDLNASDEQIVRLTGCHPECVDVIRALGRGERVESHDTWDWKPVGPEHNFMFTKPALYRIAPEPERRISATATLEDGRTVEVEFPVPVREPLEEGAKYWLAYGDEAPVWQDWEGDRDDRRYLRQGRIFRTREDAIEHDRAMIRLRGGEVE